jgi:hypothetical protein
MTGTYCIHADRLRYADRTQFLGFPPHASKSTIQHAACSGPGSGLSELTLPISRTCPTQEDNQAIYDKVLMLSPHERLL